MRKIRNLDIQYLEALTGVSCSTLRREACVDAIKRLAKEYGDKYLHLEASDSHKEFFSKEVSPSLPKDIKIKVS